MAWTTPRTWVANDELLAVQLNTDLRDNTNFLYDNAYSHHGARVYNNANISTASGSFTALTFNSERFDTDAFHDTSTNTSRLTIPAGFGGLYLITGHVQWNGSGVGVLELAVRVDGTTQIAVSGVLSTSVDNKLSIATLYTLTAGQYVELQTYQATGGALNVEVAANFSPEFAIAWLGA